MRLDPEILLNIIMWLRARAAEANCTNSQKEALKDEEARVGSMPYSDSQELPLVLARQAVLRYSVSIE